MKKAEEIITRSVILLCLSDRCALEKNIMGGRAYTKKQRDEQRQAIYQWLQNKGYSQAMTLEERALFEQEVGGANKDSIVLSQVQYEAIEPCLWSIGLMNELSSYDRFVTTDFHPFLKIGVQHSLGQVLQSSHLKSDEEIVLNKEMAMLWHWRTIEGSNPIFKTNSVLDVVESVFGQDHVNILLHSMNIEGGQKDFTVNNRLYTELSDTEKQLTNQISRWRHYAFEWIAGDVAWDEVEINT